MANVTSSGNTTIKPTINAAKFMGSSHAAGNALGNQVQGNTFSINAIKNILDSASLHSHIDNENESSGGSLEEINNILTDISNALSLDFANRITEGKEEVKGIQAQKSRGKFGRAEGRLEGSGKKIGSVFKGAESKASSPMQGIFGKILSFLGLLGTGIAANAGFEWLKDDKNKKKLSSFFNFIKENWKWMVGAAGLFIGAEILLKFAGAVMSLQGIFSFLAGPLGIAALITGAGLAWAWVTRNKMGDTQNQVIDELGRTEGNTMAEKRSNLIKKLQNQDTKWWQGGQKEEIDKRIKFLQDGFYGGFSGKERVDWSTFELPGQKDLRIKKGNMKSLNNLKSKNNVNMSFINLPGITEGSIPQGSSTVATAVPNIAAANFSDPYRQLTPKIYGIYV